MLAIRTHGNCEIASDSPTSRRAFRTEVFCCCSTCLVFLLGPACGCSLNAELVGDKSSDEPVSAIWKHTALLGHPIFICHLSKSSNTHVASICIADTIFKLSCHINTCSGMLSPFFATSSLARRTPHPRQYSIVSHVPRRAPYITKLYTQYNLRLHSVLVENLGLGRLECRQEHALEGHPGWGRGPCQVTLGVPPPPESWGPGTRRSRWRYDALDEACNCE